MARRGIDFPPDDDDKRSNKKGRARREAREGKRGGGDNAPELVIPKQEASPAVPSPAVEASEEPAVTDTAPTVAAEPQAKRPERMIPGTFNPRRFSQGVEKTYQELGERLREMGVTPERLPPATWDYANKIVDTVKDLSEAYAKESEPAKKKQIAERMERLGTKLSGTISQEVTKTAGKFQRKPNSPPAGKFTRQEVDEIIGETVRRLPSQTEEPITPLTPMPPEFEERKPEADFIAQQLAAMAAQKPKAEEKAPESSPEPSVDDSHIHALQYKASPDMQADMDALSKSEPVEPPPAIIRSNRGRPKVETAPPAAPSAPAQEEVQEEVSPNSRLAHYRRVEAEEKKRKKERKEAKRAAEEADIPPAIIRSGRGRPKIVETKPVHNEEVAASLAGAPEWAEPTLDLDKLPSVSEEKMTPAESRSMLGKLIEGYKKTLAGAKEKIGTAAEKAKEYITSRNEQLGNTISGWVTESKETVRIQKEKAAALGKYLADRNISLGEKAKTLGRGAGENFMRTSEWYRNLPLRDKVGISVVLILGSVATGGAGTFVTLLGAAKLGQRSLASAGVYTLAEGLMEKRISKKEAGGAARTKWDTWKKHGTATAASLAVFSGIPGYALKEMFEAAGGERAIELVGGMLGHQSLHAPVVGEAPPRWPTEGHPPSDTAPAGPPQPAAAAGPAPTASPDSQPQAAVPVESPAAVAAAGEAVPHTAPAPAAGPPSAGASVNVPQAAVETAPAAGKMELPTDVVESNNAAIMKGWNEFYPGEEFPGYAVAQDKIEEIMKALPTDHVASPEEVQQVIASLRAAEVGPMHEEVVANLQGQAEQELASLHQEAAGSAESASRSIPTEASAPKEVPLTHETVTITEPMPGPDLTAEQDLASQQAAEAAPAVDETQSPAPVVERGFISNQFDLRIPVAEAHIYADPSDAHTLVFGGSVAEQAKVIEEHLLANPDSVVYGTDDSKTYLIPYHLVDGKVSAGPPMRTSGVFGFFSNWMKAPGPEDLAKLIK